MKTLEVLRPYLAMGRQPAGGRRAGGRCEQHAAAAGKRPNFVMFVLLDDAGFGDPRQLRRRDRDATDLRHAGERTCASATSTPRLSPGEGVARDPAPGVDNHRAGAGADAGDRRKPKASPAEG